MNNKKQLIEKYFICFECGGVKVEYDKLGGYYFINHVSKDCLFCDKRDIKGKCK